MTGEQEIEAGLRRHFQAAHVSPVAPADLPATLAAGRKRLQGRDALKTLATVATLFGLGTVVLGGLIMRAPNQVAGPSSSKVESSASPRSSSVPSPDEAVLFVQTYEEALAAGNAAAAWAQLSPDFRALALDSDLARFTRERSEFLLSVHSRFVVGLQSADIRVIQKWALPRLTGDAVLEGSFLVAVHYPDLADSYPSADTACSSDYFLVARDQSGHQWLWWVGDTASLLNHSCSRSESDFSAP